MDIDVQQSDAFAPLAEGCRQVRGNGALTDPPFAGENEQLLTNVVHSPPEREFIRLHLGVVS